MFRRAATSTSCLEALPMEKARPSACGRRYYSCASGAASGLSGGQIPWLRIGRLSLESSGFLGTVRDLLGTFRRDTSSGNLGKTSWPSLLPIVGRVDGDEVLDFQPRRLFGTNLVRSLCSCYLCKNFAGACFACALWPSQTSAFCGCYHGNHLFFFVARSDIYIRRSFVALAFEIVEARQKRLE